MECAVNYIISFSETNDFLLQEKSRRIAPYPGRTKYKDFKDSNLNGNIYTWIYHKLKALWGMSMWAFFYVFSVLYIMA